MENTNKTALGINENIEGLLCYILGFITGILFLLLEKENKFVRFHAMQSIVLSIVIIVFNFVVGLIPVVNMLMLILWPVELLLVLFLMYKAYLGEKYKLPTIGDFAEKQLV